MCRSTEPPLAELGPGHLVACHFPENSVAARPAAVEASPAAAANSADPE